MMKDDALWLNVAAIVLLLLATVMVIGRGCMVDESQAVRALQVAGYKDVKVIDRRDWLVMFTECSSGDAAVFYAKAKNPRSEKVSLVVCTGWPFKGSTVRIP